LGRKRQVVAGKAPDRIERAAHELHDRVSAFYADVQGPGIRHIDASDDAAAVADRAWSIVSDYLAEQHSQAQG
jgi:thymidylate kinase